MDHVHFICSARWRNVVAAAVACAALATAGAATAAAAGGTSASGTSVHTIHLEGHETQHKLISQGGFGDEEIFSGNLDNAAGNFSQVGIFAGTLTSVSSAPPLQMANVDLQLQGRPDSRPRVLRLAQVTHRARGHRRNRDLSRRARRVRLLRAFRRRARHHRHAGAIRPAMTDAGH